MNEISELQKIIDNSDNIVFFGGAGVYTESGIPDFRSEKGIFKSLEKYGHSPEYLVSHTYYMNHPEEFFNYYKENLIFKDAMPNPAHLKLAELEKAGKLKAYNQLVETGVMLRFYYFLFLSQGISLHPLLSW